VYTNTRDNMFSAVKDLLWKGKGVTFEPTYILKVTWDEMAPTYKSKLTEVSVLDIDIAKTHKLVV